MRDKNNKCIDVKRHTIYKRISYHIRFCGRREYNIILNLIFVFQFTYRWQYLIYNILFFILILFNSRYRYSLLFISLHVNKTWKYNNHKSVRHRNVGKVPSRARPLKGNRRFRKTYINFHVRRSMRLVITHYIYVVFHRHRANHIG